LCIGDAAHAMSPVGGVGINLAIQDAVATANLLWRKLKDGATITQDDLDAVRRRRLLPVKIIQALQITIQNRLLTPAISGKQMRPPIVLRLFGRVPALRGIPARIVGLGPRPEHVRTPDAA
jgi:2-polyprenyl-6-methoxyphenol hydroxylase-like FAD-dependent oxidoreductase